MEFRLETENDFWETENLTREAFWNVYAPGCNEHLVLHNLRSAPVFLSELDYVAVKDEKIVGNIIYTKMIKNNVISNDIICFGPISVLPEMQKSGIGSLLIMKTLAKASDLGYKAVLITGNPEYYGRFGFVPASRFGVHLKGISPDDEAAFFMAKELEPGFLAKNSGIYNFDERYDPSESEVLEFEKHFSPKQKREPLPTDL